MEKVIETNIFSLLQLTSNIFSLEICFITFLTALSLSDNPSECVTPRSLGTSGVLLRGVDNRLRGVMMRGWFGVGPRELVFSSSEQLLPDEPAEYDLRLLGRILLGAKMEMNWMTQKFGL